MAINFPSSPTTGDLYTYLGITYQWDGTHWVRTDPAITSITTVDETIPRFNGTTGLLQTSNVFINDTNIISGAKAIGFNWDATVVDVLTITDTGASGKTWSVGPRAGTGNQNWFGIYDGTSTLSLAGGQIFFPATQNASSGANVLDDYEEGTWTPAYVLSTPGTSSWTMSGGSGGNYSKIGRNVIIEWNMSTTAYSVGSGTGNVRISGLPFTVNAGRAGTTSVVATVSWAANASVPVTAMAQSSQTYLRLFKRSTSPGLDVELIQSDPNVGSPANETVGGLTYSV